jgi:hypothetical protein
MALPGVLAQFYAEVDSLTGYLRNFAADKGAINSPSNFSLSDECLLEGMLSRVWQAWGNFCRNCFIESCLGTTNAAGLAIAALAPAQSEADVSGAAIRANKKLMPQYWLSPNSILRFEPTWGDVDVLDRIIGRLLPSNYGQLRAAFSTSSSSAKALQLIRNGAAHNNVQNLNEIRALHSAYVVFPIGHPTHAMYWVEPTSSDFLVTYVIEELKDAASAAIA